MAGNKTVSDIEIEIYQARLDTQKEVNALDVQVQEKQAEIQKLSGDKQLVSHSLNLKIAKLNAERDEIHKQK